MPAGYGKVAVLDELQARLQVSSDRIVYVGDGSSDVHVMLHVNHRDGFTVAVSETRLVTPIARRTILGDDALSRAGADPRGRGGLRPRPGAAPSSRPTAGHPRVGPGAHGPAGHRGRGELTPGPERLEGVMISAMHER